MSAGFAGSVVLQQNSTGVSFVSSSSSYRVDGTTIQHTSLSGFGTCTALVMREYLTNLTLPEPGTICQPNAGIWDSPTNSTTNSTLLARSVDIESREPLSFDEAVKAFGRSNIVRRSMLPGPKVKRFAH